MVEDSYEGPRMEGALCCLLGLLRWACCAVHAA